MTCDRPIVTFDFDGVLSRPPFGINPGRSRKKSREKPGRRNLLWLTERWRYFGRKPMPGARLGFQRACEIACCHVVTARGAQAERLTGDWLEKYLGVRPPLSTRPHWNETSAQFKVRRIRELGAIAHFEDDPFTTEWVAEYVPVFLVDWWRNRGLEGPNIHRIRRIDEALPLLAALVSEANPPESSTNVQTSACHELNER